MRVNANGTDKPSDPFLCQGSIRDENATIKWPCESFHSWGSDN